MKTDEHIDMEGHRIKGLGLPLEHNDAVPLQYVSTRVQALTDEIEKLWAQKQELIDFKKEYERQYGQLYGIVADIIRKLDRVEGDPRIGP